LGVIVASVSAAAGLRFADPRLSSFAHSALRP
jgi:hypothetical protein